MPQGIQARDRACLECRCLCLNLARAVEFHAVALPLRKLLLGISTVRLPGCRVSAQSRPLLSSNPSRLDAGASDATPRPYAQSYNLRCYLHMSGDAVAEWILALQKPKGAPVVAVREQSSVCRLSGKIRLDPKIKRLIVPGLWTDDVRPQLGQVPFAKGGCVEIPRSSEVFHVRSIAFKVPLQLCERQVMRLKRKQPEAVPRASVKRHQPVRVVFRGSGNGYDIEIRCGASGEALTLYLPTQRGASHCDKAQRKAHQHSLTRITIRL